MTTYKTPGVYIQEIPATGPIAGVGTSTAAFIGPALKGPVGVPTKITSWSAYKNTFGEYITAPRHYMSHAVEGFFKNGGTVAYITRVGTASRAFLDLEDRATDAGMALRVEAKNEGAAGNNITVQVQDAQIVTAAEASRAEAAIATTPVSANNRIHVTDANEAANFRPGDVVTITSTNERLTIDRIRGTEIIVTSNFSGTHSSGTVRIADLTSNQTTFRVQNGSGIEVGSVIRISQDGTGEDHIVDNFVADIVTLRQGLTNTFGMDSGDPPVAVQSFEFSLAIRVPNQADENFERLSMDSRHSRYFNKIVQSAAVTVRLPNLPSVSLPPENRPAILAATNLSGGTADNLNARAASHYTGGIDALNRVDDVNIVCIPDRTDATVQQAMIAHCEHMGDRFAILNAALNAPPFGAGSILEQRAALESQRGYAALYYPWIHISDPQGSNGDMLLVPPTGHIAGVYARSDAQRGVHKAPANELMTGVLKLERQLTNDEQGELNVEGINVLRVFPNQVRPNVWGARTTAPAAQTPWRYVNVRRLMLFIEESIEEGIQWAVFEPNNQALWEKLKRTIGEFLARVWRSGALFGATPEEAYYVKCDEELNPASVRALGQVYVEIGVAPVRPAEFIIVRIGQWEGGAEVSEG